MQDRQFDLALFHISVSNLKIRVRLVWMSRQNNLKLSNRVIQPVPCEKEFSHTQMSEIVSFGDRKCAMPKALRVVPERSLNPGAPAQERNDDRRGQAQNLAPITQRTQKIDNPPRHCDVEPNLREIRVAVGVGLASNLKQADHRQQHYQIPKPSGQDVAVTFSKNKRTCGGESDQPCRARDLP